MENKAVKSVETIESIEEKGVSVTTDKSNVVAVQYPDSPNYTLTEQTITDLSEKYGHLKQLDVKDKKAYKELTAAISDVKSHRTENQKQENAIKKPLNEFRTLVIDIGKKLRGKVSKIEDELKAEKQRIDDIIDEELAAQQRLWTKNLAMTISLAQLTPGMSLEALQGQLQAVEGFDIESLDFGDQLEQAKANVANAHAQVAQAIAMEKQRLKLKAEAEERAKKEAEEKAKREKEAEEQAKKDRLAEEAAAAQQKIIDDLQAQLEAKNKPESEPESKTEVIAEEDKRIGGHPVAAPKNVIDTSANDKPVSGFDAVEETEEPEQDIPTLTDLDIQGLLSLANDLAKVCEAHQVIDFQTEKASNAAFRVMGNVQKTVVFLRGVAGGES